MSRDLKLQIVLNAMGNAREKFEQITNAGNATSRALAAARKEANLLDKQQKSIAGFQKQPNAVTVQGSIEDALKIVTKKEIELTGSSRTDTGVHAWQNFFHFDSKNNYC